MNHFLKEVKKEVARSRRYHHPFALLKLDIDRLAQFNAIEGKELAEKAVKDIENLFQKRIRETDLLSEPQEGSFYLLLVETDLSQAEVVAERLRQAIEEAVFLGKKGTSYLTISVGVAQFPEGGQSAEALFRASDKSLREAKFLGKNRVVSNRSLSEANFFMAAMTGR